MAVERILPGTADIDEDFARNYKLPYGARIPNTLRRNWAQSRARARANAPQRSQTKNGVLTAGVPTGNYSADQPIAGRSARGSLNNAAAAVQWAVGQMAQRSERSNDTDTGVRGGEIRSVRTYGGSSTAAKGNSNT